MPPMPAPPTQLLLFRAPILIMPAWFPQPDIWLGPPRKLRGMKAETELAQTKEAATTAVNCILLMGRREPATRRGVDPSVGQVGDTECLRGLGSAPKDIDILTLIDGVKYIIPLLATRIDHPHPRATETVHNDLKYIATGHPILQQLGDHCAWLRSESSKESDGIKRREGYQQKENKILVMKETLKWEGSMLALKQSELSCRMPTCPKNSADGLECRLCSPEHGQVRYLVAPQKHVFRTGARRTVANRRAGTAFTNPVSLSSPPFNLNPLLIQFFHNFQPETLKTQQIGFGSRSKCLILLRPEVRPKCVQWCSVLRVAETQDIQQLSFLFDPPMSLSAEYISKVALIEVSTFWQWRNLYHGLKNLCHKCWTSSGGKDWVKLYVPEGAIRSVKKLLGTFREKLPSFTYVVIYGCLGFISEKGVLLGWMVPHILPKTIQPHFPHPWLMCEMLKCKGDMLGLGKNSSGEMNLSRRKNYYKRIEIHLEDLELCINNQHQSPQNRHRRILSSNVPLIKNSNKLINLLFPSLTSLHFQGMAPETTFFRNRCTLIFPSCKNNVHFILPVKCELVDFCLALKCIAILCPIPLILRDLEKSSTGFGQMPLMILRKPNWEVLFPIKSYYTGFVIEKLPMLSPNKINEDSFLFLLSHLLFIYMIPSALQCYTPTAEPACFRLAYKVSTLGHLVCDLIWLFFRLTHLPHRLHFLLSRHKMTPKSHPTQFYHPSFPEGNIKNITASGASDSATKNSWVCKYFKSSEIQEGTLFCGEKRAVHKSGSTKSMINQLACIQGIHSNCYNSHCLVFDFIKYPLSETILTFIHSCFNQGQNFLHNKLQKIKFKLCVDLTFKSLFTKPLHLEKNSLRLTIFFKLGEKIDCIKKKKKQLRPGRPLFILQTPI
ncbi:putative signal peptide protein [Puccinia sorghi]|uniref:Putative signal peptide protein n=1 Tax=Puccinia sorghi TaxID=27349 RepID=A0A0L6V4V4_9BASI|nr:putative signal peptide protein [Puccinia sorghi]